MSAILPQTRGVGLLGRAAARVGRQPKAVAAPTGPELPGAFDPVPGLRPGYGRPSVRHGRLRSAILPISWVLKDLPGLRPGMPKPSVLAEGDPF